MRQYKVIIAAMLAAILMLGAFPAGMAEASGIGDIVSSLASPTAPSSGGGIGGFLGGILDFVFNKLLGSALNFLGGNKGAPASNLPTPGIGSNSSSGSSSQSATGKLSGKTIAVDPGHGGGNPGAVGYNGIEEANVNLSVALKLRNLLQQSGATVVMTRETDRYVAAVGNSLGQELQARVDIAESANADIFVSLHSNSNSNSAYDGAMTFYHSGKSPQLANDIQAEMIKATNAANKGVEPETFYVLRNTSMPGVLVEMGFVSNQQEAQLLNTDGYQAKLAQGIFNGIVKYFNH